jgi:hypothetical protein
MTVEMIGNIEVMATGFATVLVVLALLWATCAMIGLSFAEHTRRGLPVPASPGAAGIPAHHLAVISAAVSAVLEAPHRIVNVAAPAHIIMAWAQEGRFDHASVHRMSWDRSAPPTGKRRQRRKIW